MYLRRICSSLEWENPCGLREYLTRMTECVIKERGTLDKYIGDAVMAIFGAPIPFDDHAERACRTALAMHDEMERLRTKWAAEGK